MVIYCANTANPLTFLSSEQIVFKAVVIRFVADIMSIPGPLPESTLKLLSQLAPNIFADTAALAAAGLLSAAYVLRGYTWDKPDPYSFIWYEKPQQGAGGNAAKKSKNIAERLEELVSASDHLMSPTSLMNPSIGQRCSRLLGLTVWHR